MNRSEPENQEPAIPAQLRAEQRIEARLAYLYGADRSAAIAQRVARLLKTHRQLRKRVVQGALWSEADTVLITYGDTIQSSTKPPLQTLHRFLKENLQNAFSMVHILPFFPSSSDDGFSVTDFRAVKQDLGSWQDLHAISEDFDLAIDLVLNHCSRENLWFITTSLAKHPPVTTSSRSTPRPTFRW